MNKLNKDTNRTGPTKIFKIARTNLKIWKQPFKKDKREKKS